MGDKGERSSRQTLCVGARRKRPLGRIRRGTGRRSLMPSVDELTLRVKVVNGAVHLLFLVPAAISVAGV